MALLTWLGFFIVSFHSCFCGHFGAHDGVFTTRQWASTLFVEAVVLVNFTVTELPSQPPAFANTSSTGNIWQGNPQLALTSSRRNTTAAE